MDQQNTDSDVDQMIDDFPDEVSALYGFWKTRFLR